MKNPMMEKPKTMNGITDNSIPLIKTILNSLIMKKFHFEFIDLLRYGLTTITIFIVMLCMLPSQILLILLLIFYILLVIVYIAINRGNVLIGNTTIDEDKLQRLRNLYSTKKINKINTKSET